jgi:membrane-bound metal-dependent hydrolase YbcI (DUF457 family)
MPLPIGHTAIGLTTYSLSHRTHHALNDWKVLVGVSILSNLPDFDIALGLIFLGNGSAFHRGPAHSLLFALVAGVLASQAWRFWSRIPRFRFMTCFLLVLSHLLADTFLTDSPISFFWPLRVYWSKGYMGWNDVFGSVFFENFQDLGIIIACGLIPILYWLLLRLRVSARGPELETTSGSPRGNPPVSGASS